MLQSRTKFELWKCLMMIFRCCNLLVDLTNASHYHTATPFLKNRFLTCAFTAEVRHLVVVTGRTAHHADKIQISHKWITMPHPSKKVRAKTVGVPNVVTFTFFIFNLSIRLLQKMINGVYSFKRNMKFKRRRYLSNEYSEMYSCNNIKIIL